MARDAFLKDLEASPDDTVGTDRRVPQALRSAVGVALPTPFDGCGIAAHAARFELAPDGAALGAAVFVP